MQLSKERVLAILYGVMANRMYLYGLEFMVVTDHQPLVNLYNNPKRTEPVRVEQHRLKLQGYNFSSRISQRYYQPDRL